MTERSIFFDLLAIADPDERAAHLDRECAGNPALRSEVESLLRAHEEVGAFMERPAEILTTTANYPPVTTRPSTMIGPYKIMEQIGEGGMGLVLWRNSKRPFGAKWL